MLKQFLSNFYTEIFIYIFCILIVLVLFQKRITMETNSKEHFTNRKKTNSKRRTINSIIPAATEDNLFFGSYISSSKNKKKEDINNFVYTRSLKSNNWIKVPENALLNKKTLVLDLNYDQNKNLICVGLSMKNGEPVYDIFVKENNNYKSKWIKMNSNKKIRSLGYDLNSENMIGINSYDGQIYEKSLKGSKTDFVRWIGPINFDKPMKKVLFDRNGYMIGIGLIDNYIYKKIEKDWRNSEWDKKNVNETKVYDLFYDKDGCLIASTPFGVMKQLHPDFNSEFVDIRRYPEKHTELLSSYDILKFRVGVEFLDDEFDTTTELGRNLKRIYEFKKVSKDLCGKKLRLRKGNSSNQNSELSKQNREINKLYNIIDKISDKMNY